MTHRLLVVAGILSSIVLSAASARACGDKFLTPGRAPAPAAYVAERPASILILASQDSDAMARVGSQSMRAELERAGHNVRVCKAVEECSLVAREGRVDIVLADLRAAREFSTTRRLASSPVVVPVAIHPRNADVKLAGFEPAAVYDASRRPRALLRFIDEALDLRR